MSREASAKIQLVIRVKNATTGKVELFYPGMSGGGFTADVASPAKGPFPGSMAIPTTGLNVDLSQQTRPGGLCEWGNQDGTNFIEIGVFDTSADEFIPIFEALPGESFINRLSRRLSKHYPQTGTPQVGTDIHLRVKADTAACNGFVNAFDK